MSISYITDEDYEREYDRKLTRKRAEDELPGAAKIVRVYGAYAGFDTWTDYETWRNQR